VSRPRRGAVGEGGRTKWAAAAQNDPRREGEREEGAARWAAPRAQKGQGPHHGPKKGQQGMEGEFLGFFLFSI
jgi:hypothetical protein